MRFSTPLVPCLLLVAVGSFSGCFGGDREWDRTKSQISRLAEQGGQHVESVTGVDPSQTINAVTAKGQEAVEWCRETGKEISYRMPRSEMEARKMFLSWFVGSTGWNSNGKMFSQSVQQVRSLGNSGGAIRGGSGGGGHRRSVPASLSPRRAHGHPRASSGRRRS